MPNSHFEAIYQYARTLNIESFAADLAQFSHDNNLSEENLRMVEAVFHHMAQLKNEAVVTTLLRTSRLPLKNPKTFENFDFSRLHGRNIDRLTNLPALTAEYAHRNLAFIGPQGVGKTHLAMAYGRACCEKGMKAFFLKASELNQRLLDARRMDRCGAAINFLVKPSCLIIDEVGRCVFDSLILPDTVRVVGERVQFGQWDADDLLCSLHALYRHRLCRFRPTTWRGSDGWHFLSSIVPDFGYEKRAFQTCLSADRNAQKM